MPATFPTDVPCVMGSYSEDRDSAVLRSEMERGVPKQRRLSSDVMVQVKVTLQFRDQAHAQTFETWFDSQIAAGTDWFTWKHPRTGLDVLARIVGGTLGQLSPVHGTWRTGRQRCRRDATFEYLKQAY